MPEIAVLSVLVLAVAVELEVYVGLERACDYDRDDSAALLRWENVGERIALVADAVDLEIYGPAALDGDHDSDDVEAVHGDDHTPLYDVECDVLPDAHTRPPHHDYLLPDHHVFDDARLP